MKLVESLNTTTTEILTRRRIATQGVWRVSVNRYILCEMWNAMIIFLQRRPLIGFMRELEGTL